MSKKSKRGRPSKTVSQDLYQWVNEINELSAVLDQYEENYLPKNLKLFKSERGREQLRKLANQEREEFLPDLKGGFPTEVRLSLKTRKCIDKYCKGRAMCQIAIAEAIELLADAFEYEKPQKLARHGLVILAGCAKGLKEKHPETWRSEFYDLLAENNYKGFEDFIIFDKPLLVKEIQPSGEPVNYANKTFVKAIEHFLIHNTGTSPSRSTIFAEFAAHGLSPKK